MARRFKMAAHSNGNLEEEPVREELFSIERLEEYAEWLAGRHRVVASRKPKLLLPRLEENAARLVQSYRALSQSIKEERVVSPAADWLVDNFHIVEEQLREIRHDLPRGYYKELPMLADGDLAGFPRIYGVSLALIAHTDSHLDLDHLKRFILAYQRKTILSIGELWAVAITLRLALVENLRRLSTRVISARDERRRADELADAVIRAALGQATGVISLLTGRLGKRRKLSATFVAQFTQRLRDQDPGVGSAIDWLNTRLGREGKSAEELVRTEHQRQAASQVTVANVVTSMRLLSTIDWRDFFESVSLIEPVLKEDPAGAYRRMDFETRDRYRHVIERIGKRTAAVEIDVARRVLQLAQRTPETGPRDHRHEHVGWYLIDEGRVELERAFGYKPAVAERTARLIRGRSTFAYLGALSLGTILLLVIPLLFAWRLGAGAIVLTVLGLLTAVPAGDMALSLLNWLVTSVSLPRKLPKIDLSSGIPEAARTMVVVPTLLSDAQVVQELFERLEVCYLANQDPHLHFALLSDFPDAAQEKMPDDDAILEAAKERVAKLNAAHCREGETARFYMFHRSRKWNPAEQKWMGWERKRGKLHEFNLLLRGAKDTSFVISTCEPGALPQIRYVITLDSDTQLPRDAARRLIGTILHPLNQARIDPAGGFVRQGYGILQPRVSISLESAARSRFSRIVSGNTGVDPYTTAVSDVYQDLFGEGIYTGKGVYDLDAFDAALAGRVPENSLLSHDLFEGLFARTALVTDIEVFDEYPARYDSYAKRQHRWARGDWQIAGWIFPRAPGSSGRRVRNALPLISRWKIFDNLRRSLVAPSAFLWLIFAWTILPGPGWLWAVLILLMLAFPVLAHVTTGMLVHPHGIPWTSHFWSIWGDAGANVLRVALTITFLPHQAYLMTDAILRTLYRMIISRRNLLEWVTAAEAQGASPNGWSALLWFMWPAVAGGFAALALIMAFKPDSLPVAAPFLLLWVCSPLVAHWMSLDVPKQVSHLEERDVRDVRLIARRTWRYFEVFVGELHHWLPPDNYQEDPNPIVAHRTSPTNVGLLLLSTAASRDFGYVGLLEMAERMEMTFATFEKLQRFHGHFFNWYDTHTLEPLRPRYVSTVDSGNLAGHMLAVKQTCIGAANQPLFDARVQAGLADTAALLREEALRLTSIQRQAPGLTAKHLHDEIEAYASLVTVEPPSKVSEWAALFDSLTARVEAIDDIVDALAHEHGDKHFEELRFWIAALAHETGAHSRDLETLTPGIETSAKELRVRLKDYPAPILEQWLAIETGAGRVTSLSGARCQCDAALVSLAALRSQIERQMNRDNRRVLEELDAVSRIAARTLEASESFLARLDSIARLCDRFIGEMDFRFLFDEERKVLTIGYNVTDGLRDDSFYDLLASEARLTSFIAIATGDVPQEHWFRLGRQLTSVNGKRALISWSATMFEYLMPLLVMRSYEGTLLDQTHRAAVDGQIKYGEERGIPWGVSESAYNARDLQLNYQYGPFGVPGMGLKRGLSEDLVVAPYATFLAAMIKPNAAISNLRRLEKIGMLSRYGLYEAIDYTPERLPKNQKQQIIRAYMTHHQGMTLVALDNLLHENVMQRRFHGDPLVQSTELLLQERVPRATPVTHPRNEETRLHRLAEPPLAPSARRYNSPDVPTPRTQLLSNGSYSVMITTAGAGYSMCGSLAVTRWREDATRDHWGAFCYLRDVRSGAIWSAGYQPVCRAALTYEVALAEHKVDIRRKDAGVATHTEIVVSPEDNAEIRRVSITNQSSREREIEVTSYQEVVLAPPAADVAHPAFSNLSVETEFIAKDNALLAHRRGRPDKERQVWGVHTIAIEGGAVGDVQYETNRARFLGRGHTPREPAAIMEDRPLSNTAGAVLDPIFSLRARIRLQPNETARVSFATGVAHSRDDALRLADKYREAAIFDRAEELAWTRSQVEMRHFGIDANEASLFQRLASRLLYLDPTLRPRPHVLALNTKTQENLWPFGIGGDLPILLVRINQARDLERVRRILSGHEYLRMKGLSVDLVILNDYPPSYSLALQDELQALIRKSGAMPLMDKPGGVHVRRTDIMPEADRILLHTAARAGLVTERGSLEEHLSLAPLELELPGPFVPRKPPRVYPAPPIATPELAFFNGLGGFRQDGREYLILLGEDQWTPAPWLNVIANELDFGFQVSETGSGYTWSVNSGENRLSPWANDPVSDPPGEVIYVRDEDTGAIWTPTPLPIRESSPYLIGHGHGYTKFEHASHGVNQELSVFAPLDARVKISLLRLENTTGQRRSLSVTSYNELVLGKQRERAAPFTITDIHEQAGTILARNPYNNEFAHRIAFAAMNLSGSTRENAIGMTCDRKEFIGRNGSLARPAALNRTKLSGRSGAGFDPCAALQCVVELGPGESREIVVLFGEGESVEEATSTISLYREAPAAKKAFEAVAAYWDELLTRVEIHTPDAAADMISNRWLLYQTLACRMWARSALYQSSGAYGFRDQVQDSMALVYAEPGLARQQILRAASRQFKDGDVQHWWHPPTGRGVRTRSSDDLLWLPYAAAFYIDRTGDASLLDEETPFIDAPPLAKGAVEYYLQPTVSAEMATVYEHCARALDHSLAVGSHGLPLMGSGDWNDAMNRVGREGKGESVWLGWFLYATLKAFLPFCGARRDEERTAVYRNHMTNLTRALEQYGWDGGWYRRAYFDDGAPIGSADDDECRIDSIAQSWAVISGAADPKRAAIAMAAAEQHLVKRADKMVLLFTPPFDKSDRDPGYVKEYLPGVRENGGQYSHAALWQLIANTMLGDGDRAGELFAILNPINHASTRAGMHRYKVEPYVVAGDVYSTPSQIGRGGWTWYTGSAGWMYRAILESILGFQLLGGRFVVSPCIPRSWREYKITYRAGSTSYRIQVENPGGVSCGVARVEEDGEPRDSAEIIISDDGKTHFIRIILGEPPLPGTDLALETTEHPTPVSLP